MQQAYGAERRNLVLLSAAFIVYYAADGSLDGAAVTVPGISVALGSPEAVGVLAWIALIWFIIRFYQETGRHVVSEFRNEVNSWMTPPWLKNRIIEFVTSEDKRTKTTKEGVHIDEVEFGYYNGSWGANFNVCDLPAGRSRPGSATGCTLKGRLLWSALAFYVVAITISGVSISRYISPYLLALIAMVGPIWNQFIHGGI